MNLVGFFLELCRNEGNRKENETPRRRSHSPSPRHSRRSSSSHRFRRSRSPVRCMYRPRSRSPRICHRFIPRYRSRSRSPYRMRNPFRGSPKCFRSVSPERTSRRSERSSGTFMFVNNKYLFWLNHFGFFCSLDFFFFNLCICIKLEMVTYLLFSRYF